MKKYLIGFGLGAIIFASIGVYAGTRISASQIEYKETTVEDAIDTLYTTQDTTVSNLESELNDYKSKFDSYKETIWAVTASNSYSSSARLIINDNDGLKKYKHFKILEVTNLQNSSICKIQGYAASRSAHVDMNINQQYDTSSSTDGYGFTTLTLWVRSNTNGTEARCRAIVQFYN